MAFKVVDPLEKQEGPDCLVEAEVCPLESDDVGVGEHLAEEMAEREEGQARN